MGAPKYDYEKYKSFGRRLRRSDFRSHEGGSNANSSRASLRDLNKQERVVGNSSAENSVKAKEENPSNVIQGPWEDKTSIDKKTENKPKTNFLKKKGPLVVILGGVGGLGAIFTLLFSPGVLIVQMKEIMVDKFNYQLASMDIRSGKIFTHKIDGATTGLCGSKISIKCKISSMTESQMAKLEKNGIKVKYEKTSITGRIKPSSLEFEGKTILAKDFKIEYNKNPKFRTAYRKAFNSKYIGFSGSVWAKIKAKYKLSKQESSISGATDEEKLKSIQEETKSGKTYDTEISDEQKFKAGESVDGSDVTIDEVEANDLNDDLAKNVDRIDSVADEIADSGDKAATQIADELSSTASNSLDAVGNTFKITGFLDSSCTVFRTIQAVGYGAKTIRAAQLARYAMIFLNVADQIKAGTAKASDVEYLGKILTTETTRTTNSTTRKLKSATDSEGYKYAAYGDKVTLGFSASQFLVGGGLTGDFINLSSIVLGALNGTPRKTCRTLSNPWVSGGSAIIGIALMFIPGVNVAIGAKDIAQAAAGIAMTVAAAFLPGLLDDMIAGKLVDSSTVGESAGNALTSGSGVIMSGLASASGNAPLNPTQAVAYNSLNQEILAQYAEEDRLNYSPLDATNKNTFLGKIVATLLPYSNNFSSFSNSISSISSIISTSFSSLTKGTFATSSASEDYTTCTDYDYREMNLATDPFCNIVFGSTDSALSKDPLDVIDYLIGKNQIYEYEEDGHEAGSIVEGSDFENFISTCINRTTPFGDGGDSFDESQMGYGCIIGDSKSNYPDAEYYYDYYIDILAESGMSGE